MPENVIASTGAASTTNTGNSVTTGGDKGGNTTVAEPRIGWAGQDDHVQDDHAADDTREDAIDRPGEGDEDLSSEFGDESFDDDVETGQKKDVPFKDLLEQLKSEDAAVVKAAEKQMKRDFFENRRYKQVPGCETPEKARALVDKLQTLGGVEGIEREIGEGAKFFSMIDAGDPALIAGLATKHPEGLAKLAPHVLEHFEKHDPQGWAHSMAAVFMATMNQAPAGGISALAAINALHKAFPEMAKSPEFGRVAEVINAVADIAAQAPAKDAKTDDKIKQREQQVAERENAVYNSGVSAKILPEMKKLASNAIAAATKGRKLSEDAKNDLKRDVNLEYAQLAKADGDLQKKLKALLSAKDTEGFVRTAKAHMERTMPMAAKRVWRKYAGIAGLNEKDLGQRRAEGESRRESGGGGSTSGTIKTATPSPADVDWSRMRQEFGRDKADDMFLFQRKYYKKGDAKNVYSH